MEQEIRGIIVNYRLGLKTQKSKEYIIQFNHVNSRLEASRLLGRKVACKSNKKKIVGKIVALHGKKGLVRARFRKGLPGKVLGGIVELVG